MKDVFNVQNVALMNNILRTLFSIIWRLVFIGIIWRLVCKILGMKYRPKQKGEGMYFNSVDGKLLNNVPGLPPKKPKSESTPKRSDNLAPKKSERPAKNSISDIKKKSEENPSFANKSSNKGVAKTGSVAESVKKRQGELVYLVRGKNQGKEAWHYVLVKKELLSVFKAKTQGGSLDVADYGDVIKSGWGKDPDEAMVKWIQDTYG